MAKKIDRTIIDPVLLSRIQGAAANGSTVAAGILEELKKPRTDIFRSTRTNYLNGKITRQGCGDFVEIKKYECGYISQNFDDERNPYHGIPDAGERNSTHCWTTPSSFASLFKNLSFTHDELDFFESAIREPTKVTITIGDKFKDFLDAYNASNYSVYTDYDGPLHKSCMRHDSVSEIAADFYKNFAGAKIMIARNGNREIVGRAILWTGVDIYDNNNATLLYKNVSFLDRKYFAFAFVRTMMLREAERLGINFTKAVDDIYTLQTLKMLVPTEMAEGCTRTPYSVGDQFDGAMIKKVPQIKWHKKGAPYVDTMCHLVYNDYEKQLMLSNYNDGRGTDSSLAECRETSGWADRCGCLCPVCGKRIYRGDMMEGEDFCVCRSCYNQMFEKTGLGYVYKGKLLTYNGHQYPAKVVRSPYLEQATRIERLFRHRYNEDDE